ncbi:hypothetical protein VP01_2091g1 [Puccinia sorghi]|uniref:Uncharacterized protein n=1 Tax=Puccinia sorghi TaxID=27349 RepID=A0A0L6VA91_9BASI|nr:hypothetical protein VP01_2091g1 [Puccinia sorghi]
MIRRTSRTSKKFMDLKFIILSSTYYLKHKTQRNPRSLDAACNNATRTKNCDLDALSFSQPQAPAQVPQRAHPHNVPPPHPTNPGSRVLSPHHARIWSPFLTGTVEIARCLVFRDFLRPWGSLFQSETVRIQLSTPFFSLSQFSFHFPSFFSASHLLCALPSSSHTLNFLTTPQSSLNPNSLSTINSSQILLLNHFPVQLHSSCPCLLISYDLVLPCVGSLFCILSLINPVYELTCFILQIIWISQHFGYCPLETRKVSAPSETWYNSLVFDNMRCQGVLDPYEDHDENAKHALNALWGLKGQKKKVFGSVRRHSACVVEINKKMIIIACGPENLRVGTVHPEICRRPVALFVQEIHPTPFFAHSVVKKQSFLFSSLAMSRSNPVSPSTTSWLPPATNYPPFLIHTPPRSSKGII